MTDHAVIAEHLWQEYGYRLPDAPGSMAHGVLLALHQKGYIISKVVTNE